jgi:hypothetical protein
MAKQNHKTSPLMYLSIMALFSLMVPIYTIATSPTNVQRSQAASGDVSEATPSPSPEVDFYR